MKISQLHEQKISNLANQVASPFTVLKETIHSIRIRLIKDNATRLIIKENRTTGILIKTVEPETIANKFKFIIKSDSYSMHAAH